MHLAMAGCGLVSAEPQEPAVIVCVWRAAAPAGRGRMAADRRSGRPRRCSFARCGGCDSAAQFGAAAELRFGHPAGGIWRVTGSAGPALQADRLARRGWVDLGEPDYGPDRRLSRRWAALPRCACVCEGCGWGGGVVTDPA
jgi:hypothetical protein